MEMESFISGCGIGTTEARETVKQREKEGNPSVRRREDGRSPSHRQRNPWNRFLCLGQQTTMHSHCLHHAILSLLSRRKYCARPRYDICSRFLRRKRWFGDPLSKFRAVYQRGHDQKFIRVVDGFKISRELLSRTDLINCHCSKSFSRFRDNFCEQTNLRFIIPEIMSVYLSSNSNYF